jgi:hypothetical protein
MSWQVNSSTLLRLITLSTCGSWIKRSQFTVLKACISQTRGFWAQPTSEIQICLRLALMMGKSYVTGLIETERSLVFKVGLRVLKGVSIIWSSQTIVLQICWARRDSSWCWRAHIVRKKRWVGGTHSQAVLRLVSLLSGLEKKSNDSLIN